MVRWDATFDCHQSLFPELHGFSFRLNGNPPEKQAVEEQNRQVNPLDQTHEPNGSLGQSKSHQDLPGFPDIWFRQ